ncbi:MAG: M48 family metallopeptidase [Candidatus Delongbacteria bacterium]|nr:M48 family metallopeptidase [Candidatus Delongbacteria bacterium]MCG2761254.1 M48 family metallopeptidase [Candidatus Delongbacteria bacterium]
MEIDGYEILIIKSKARKKTVQAKLVGDRTIKVLAPYRVGAEYLDDFIVKSVKKLSSKGKISDTNEFLYKRAEMLRKKFIPEAPDFEIGYSNSLRTTWGKCFISDKNIVLNTKLKNYPLWVVDLVIIHEIAHLIFHNHGKGFRSIVSRYKLKERATGYLLAKGMKASDI